MIPYKVYYAVLMWRLGKRKILPSSFVNAKKIKDNNSPMIDISKDNRFSMDRRAVNRGGCWVRSELVPMLRTAAAKLPSGTKLHFFGGWRHIAVQWAAWNEQIAEKKKLFPDKSNEEIKQLVRMTAGDPSRGGYGPHQTGGAIDLTIIGADGKELDMGTSFSYHGIEAQTDYPNISETQKKNRDLLRNALHSLGFQNYPGEWWHYSFGDRAWAAYKRKPFALYAETFVPEYKLKEDEKEGWSSF